jgi:hypothetical protein
MHVTYGFHDVLSRGADFQGMISELNVICKVCADLALFGGKKFVSHDKTPSNSNSPLEL